MDPEKQNIIDNAAYLFEIGLLTREQLIELKKQAKKQSDANSNI